MSEEKWGIMSGTAIEDEPKAEPRIEVKFYDCNLKVSGELAKMLREYGLKHQDTTENADGTRSIFYKLR
ncbi:MAG: hypothetical protein PHO03_06290 [Candidatus Omnitrophica bacterium]|nr:hypothetical protein [Candidatus Omnitrophota bacterium]